MSAGHGQELYWVPPVFAVDRDPEYLYGIVLLANRRLLKRCFQAIVRYLDTQNAMKLRMVTNEINREGERAMYRVWRYLVAVNLSSFFITLPAVGRGEGQMSFTRAVYEFFTNKRQEVLIMGGFNASGDYTSEVTKMIVEPNGTIRFEASTSMLHARGYQDAVYHQGEVFSISCGAQTVAYQGSMERLDKLTQTQTMLAERLPNNLHYTTAAVFDDKLLAIGGFSETAGRLDVVYTLDEHASQAGQGKWSALEARLNTARCSAAAIVFEGKVFVCGGCGADRSVESFDPAIGALQVEGEQLTKYRRSSCSLCEFEDELYAMGGDNPTTIEKCNKATKRWELVADCGQDRRGCAAALVGSKIFLLGGYDHKSTFDFFDLHSKKWASQTKGRYEKESARKLPRQVYHSKAVLITPSAAKAKEWTDLNVVKLEDRDTARYNERFETITGKAIAWQWDA